MVAVALKSPASLTFQPRSSHGWVWLILIALLTLVVSVGTTLLLPGEVPWPILLLNIGLGLVIGLPGLALAVCFPTMRYELDDQALTLRYGPVLHYHIPLARIRSIRRRNLSISLWSSLRLPGLALFTVPYSDVGKVKMCATAAADRILLIETDDATYGLTPADEEGFVAALMARMEE
ncbi:MAG: hypothetical protein FJ014_00250 [Chloroflexi bacterium]|nr:hypothetical protein [Chloroflexota bacterium]